MDGRAGFGCPRQSALRIAIVKNGTCGEAARFVITGRPGCVGPLAIAWQEDITRATFALSVSRV
jgi:hypothetical protein